MECEKCNIQPHPGDSYIDFCPLHAAAEELLEACKVVAFDLEHKTDVDLTANFIEVLNRAIAKAEGK